MERAVLWAVRSTQTSINTFFIMIALERHLTLMSKRSVEFNLFANSRFIFANGLSDGSFCGAISNTGENDTPFL